MQRPFAAISKSNQEWLPESSLPGQITRAFLLPTKCETSECQPPCDAVFKIAYLSMHKRLANVKTVDAIEFDNHLETLNTSIFGSVLFGDRYM